MEEFIFIFFGWLLGLLSPLIVDLYRDKKQGREFLHSSIAELRDLQFILANTVFLLELKYGRLTVELVQLVSEVTGKYEGNEPTQNVPETLERLRGLTQDELDAAAAQLPADERVGSSLKRMEPRYVISNLRELSKQSSDLQLRFYELLRTLDVMNQEIPKIDVRADMTFDSSISEENHESLLTDLRNRYVFVAGQCRKAIEKIEAIVAQACP